MKRILMILSLIFSLSSLAKERCEAIVLMDISKVTLRSTCQQISTAMFLISENTLPEYEVIDVEPLYPHRERSVLKGMCTICYSKD